MYCVVLLYKYLELALVQDECRFGVVPEVFVLDDLARSEAAPEAFAGGVVQLVDEVEGPVSPLKMRQNCP